MSNNAQNSITPSKISFPAGNGVKPGPNGPGPHRPSVDPAVGRKMIESRPAPINIWTPPKPVAQPAVGGTSLNTVQGPASIAELARALNNNVDEIYEFVYNNIEFHCTYGLQKGGWGALMDGFGNSFDQSDLMVQLLTAAGYTASYVSGTAQLTVAQLTAWLGTTTWSAAEFLLSDGGIPASEYTDGTTDWVQFAHCLVQVNISGTNYVFDPTIKSYTTKTAINLATATGYTQAAFMADAESGATVTANSVQNLNTTKIHADLSTYAMNLASWIRTNNTGAGLDDILGGRNIVPTVGTIRNTAYPFLQPGTTPTVWTSIPTSYKATMQVIYDTINVTFFSADLCGRRLSLFFNTSNQAVLRLEGTVVGTSSVRTPGNTEFVSINIDHAYAYYFEFDYIFAITTGTSSVNVIANYWGAAGRGILEYRRQQLAQAKFAGTSDTDESTLGESLNMMYLDQYLVWNKACDIVDRLTGCQTSMHNDVGMLNWATGLTVGMNKGGTAWNSSSLSGAATVYPTVLVQMLAGFSTEGLGIQEIIGIPAVSAETALDAANTQGYKIFLATPSNWSGTVEPALTNYDSGTLSSIQTSINNGDSLLIPSNGDISFPGTVVNGVGYVDFDSANDGGGVGVVLGYFGGVAGQLINPPAVNQNAQNNGDDPNDNLPADGPNMVADPVNMSSGAFLYKHDDLSIGSGSSPYSITFSRIYNSASRLVNKGLGLGWSHSLQMSASVSSDGFKGTGSDNAIDAVASIATYYVLNDLITGTTSPVVDNYSVALLAIKWWTDQMTNNTVTITLPTGDRVFTLLPDGSYSTPSGSSSTLVKNVSGTYTMKSAQQIAMNFNASGQISTIVYPSGVTWTFTYASGVLQSVTNGLGRTITLNYTAGVLSSVTDGTGRSVSFAIDSNNDLTVFTNAVSDQTTFSYDIPGRMTKFFLPANPTVAMVTNVYDTLNRVKTQSNALNQQTNFYLGGSRCQMTDPLGNSQVWYYNSRAAILKQIDALGNATLNVYDGRNRLISKTLPEGNYFQYSYDGKDNVLTVTAVPKSGSGLANIVTSYTYDATYNKMHTFKDGRGNTTTYNYDPSTGNLLTVMRPVIGGSIPTVTYTYNARGQILTTQDESGIVTANTYSSSNETMLTSVLDYSTSSGHLNLTTQFGYDTVGNTNSVTDPNLNTSVSVFDNRRFLTQVTSASPFSYVTNFTYDKNGSLLTNQRQTGSGTNPWQIDTWTYSLTGKKKTYVDSASKLTTWNYDGKDRLSNVIDAMSREWQYAYDQLDRLFTTTDPTNTISDTRTYTNNGLLSTVKDARSETTHFIPDGFDRRAQTTYADSSTEKYTSYDANGNLLTFVTRSGSTIVSTYDVLNRLSTKAPTGQPTVTYVYDLAGRLLTASKPVVSGDPSSGTFTTSYDTAGRLMNEQCPDGKTVTSQLDANGNVTKITYPDSYYVVRVFDQLNRLTDIKLNGATSSAAHITYDELSRRTALSFSNGASVAYTYQSAIVDDLTILAHTFVGSSVSLGYGYDNDHEINSHSTTDNTYLWYPGAAGTTAYGAASSVNEYPTVGTATYSYNGNACLSGDGTWTYGYDTENHLTSVSKTGTSVASLYDPFHRQTQKSVTVGGTTTKSRYVYSGWQHLACLSGDLKCWSNYCLI